ncbi:hypothetical protein SNEBB_011172 [Seison nebaliae]|nr:hypothetical protein SNEBB_011172 [Seison nebaliae]
MNFKSRRTHQIQAIVSSIGYLDESRNIYIRDADCYASLRELERVLRMDTETMKCRREMIRLKIVQKHLIPLLKLLENDVFIQFLPKEKQKEKKNEIRERNKTKRLVDTENEEETENVMNDEEVDQCIFNLSLRLLADLSKPALLCYKREVPTNKNEYSEYLYLQSTIQEMKDFCCDELLLESLMKLFQYSLENNEEIYVDDKRKLLERILIFIRNMLHVHIDTHYHTETYRSDVLLFQRQFIKCLITTNFFPLLLFIMSNEELNDEINLYLFALDIIYSILSNIKVDELVSFTDMYSKDKKIKRNFNVTSLKEMETEEPSSTSIVTAASNPLIQEITKQLENALQSQNNRRNKRKRENIRHTDFGGMYEQKNKEENKNRVFLHPPNATNEKQITYKHEAKRLRRYKNKTILEEEQSKDQRLNRLLTSTRIQMQLKCDGDDDDLQMKFFETIRKFMKNFLKIHAQFMRNVGQKLKNSSEILEEDHLTFLYVTTYCLEYVRRMNTSNNCGRLEKDLGSVDRHLSVDFLTFIFREANKSFDEIKLAPKTSKEKFKLSLDVIHSILRLFSHVRQLKEKNNVAFNLVVKKEIEIYSYNEYTDQIFNWLQQFTLHRLNKTILLLLLEIVDLWIRGQELYNLERKEKKRKNKKKKKSIDLHPSTSQLFENIIRMNGKNFSDEKFPIDLVGEGDEENMENTINEQWLQIERHIYQLMRDGHSFANGIKVVDLLIKKYGQLMENRYPINDGMDDGKLLEQLMENNILQTDNDNNKFILKILREIFEKYSKLHDYDDNDIDDDDDDNLYNMEFVSFDYDLILDRLTSPIFTKWLFFLLNDYKELLSDSLRSLIKLVRRVLFDKSKLFLFCSFNLNSLRLFDRICHDEMARASYQSFQLKMRRKTQKEKVNDDERNYFNLYSISVQVLSEFTKYIGKKPQYIVRCLLPKRAHLAAHLQYGKENEFLWKKRQEKQLSHWHQTDDDELKLLFEQFKIDFPQTNLNEKENISDCVSYLAEHLSIRKSERVIKKRLLELELIEPIDPNKKLEFWINNRVEYLEEIFKLHFEDETRLSVKDLKIIIKQLKLKDETIRRCEMKKIGKKLIELKLIESYEDKKKTSIQTTSSDLVDLDDSCQNPDIIESDDNDEKFEKDENILDENEKHIKFQLSENSIKMNNKEIVDEISLNESNIENEKNDEKLEKSSHDKLTRITSSSESSRNESFSEDMTKEEAYPIVSNWNDKIIVEDVLTTEMDNENERDNEKKLEKKTCGELEEDDLDLLTEIEKDFFSQSSRR